MHRFFVPPASITDDSVALSGDVARQLFRVLRARPGDRVVVLDDSGWEYVVILDHVAPGDVRGRVTDRLPGRGETGIKITLHVALLKSDRFEFVLQKGTELGVSVFVPVVCQRSIPRSKSDRLTARDRRWRRIIAEAAEQSGRSRLPILRSPIDFVSACDESDRPGLISWEEEEGTGLKTALRRLGRMYPAVNIFIGPEGGFTSDEVETARARGIVSVSLGYRILRAETAAIATVAAILYEVNELGV